MEAEAGEGDKLKVTSNFLTVSPLPPDHSLTLTGSSLSTLKEASDKWQQRSAILRGEAAGL